MLKFPERTDSWNAMMLAPAATAAKHARREELGIQDGLQNFGTPILMVYLPLILAGLALSGNFNLFFISTVLAGLALTVLWIFLFSFAFTALSYGAGMLLGCHAKYGRLYYMISLASAPTFVFTLVINVAFFVIKAILSIVWPSGGQYGALLGIFSLAGDAVAVSVTIYGMYLLTVSMSALYKIGKLKATAIWLIPIAILLGIAVTAFGAFIVFTAINGAFRFA